MIIRVISVGKTRQSYVKDGLSHFLKRMTHYARVEWVELDDPVMRSPTPDSQRRSEAELLLRQMQQGDFVVLLDERGSEFTSESFAAWMNKRMSAGVRCIVFVIGGAYGFHDTVRARADQSVCLSRMTFPHDLVRLILAEQLYRAFTILKGEKYHHP
jgi:23S rRNA (pseudouridine1915-N3)-methyltransferase